MPAKSAPDTIRLNKFLAERLGLSRREADDAIANGKVTINGKTAVLGDRINRDEFDKNIKVCYNGNIVPLKADFLYLAFNKPVGYVCSRKAQGSAPTIYDVLPKKYHHLKTVGRLDKDSSGLILLTNDGNFAFKMTHPKFRKNKVYEVELDKPLEPLHQQMISDFGVMLEDGPSQFKIIANDFTTPLLKGVRSAAARGVAPAAHGRPPLGTRTTRRVDGPAGRAPKKKVLQNQYTVILCEGRNRQIRRTFAALGYKVAKLHRTSFGPYELKELNPGEYQEFKI